MRYSLSLKKRIFQTFEIGVVNSLSMSFRIISHHSNKSFELNLSVNCHFIVATVSELEGMVQGQRQLMEKLTAECKTLTKRLEDTTHKHK